MNRRRNDLLEDFELLEGGGGGGGGQRDTHLVRRLSRNSSNDAGLHRRHSGSKRSYDFDKDMSKDHEDGYWEKLPVSWPYPRHITPDRERVAACYGPGGVCQDPRFVGGDGITFYFHGKKDHDFCLLTDSDLHINAHFIGKTAPSKPREYTWVQSIVVLLGDHNIYLGAQKTATWNDSVDRLTISYDESPIELPNEEGAMWQSSDESSTTIIRSANTNAVTIEVDGKFKITASVVPITEEESRVHNYGVTSDDCFAHLELGFKFYSVTNDVHGVLGQTYREGYVSRVKMSSAMPIMGGDHQFSTSDLYAPDFTVARFGKGDAADSAFRLELAGEVLCASGVDGSGIVCKK